jgi:hypothetical protein
MAIYSDNYFVKGNIPVAPLVVEETDYHGNLVDTRSYVGDLEGIFILTLATESFRESRTYSNFRDAMKMSNGYWARQAIWHQTPAGRKRVIRWA